MERPPKPTRTTVVPSAEEEDLHQEQMAQQDLQLMQQMLAKQVEVLQQLCQVLGGLAATAEPALPTLPPQQDQYWPRSAYIPPELRGQLDQALPMLLQESEQEPEQESTRCHYIPPEMRGLP